MTKLEAIKDNIEEILDNYPEKVRPLLKHQIITMIEYIGREKESYQKDSDVQKVMNLLLSEIIQGRFIL